MNVGHTILKFSYSKFYS